MILAGPFQRRTYSDSTRHTGAVLPIHMAHSIAPPAPSPEQPSQPAGQTDSAEPAARQPRTSPRPRASATPAPGDAAKGCASLPCSSLQTALADPFHASRPQKRAVCEARGPALRNNSRLMAPFRGVQAQLACACGAERAPHSGHRELGGQQAVLVLGGRDISIPVTLSPAGHGGQHPAPPVDPRCARRRFAPAFVFQRHSLTFIGGSFIPAVNNL